MKIIINLALNSTTSFITRFQIVKQILHNDMMKKKKKNLKVHLI